MTSTTWGAPLRGDPRLSCVTPSAYLVVSDVLAEHLAATDLPPAYLAIVGMSLVRFCCWLRSWSSSWRRALVCTLRMIKKQLTP